MAVLLEPQSLWLEGGVDVFVLSKVFSWMYIFLSAGHQHSEELQSDNRR